MPSIDARERAIRRLHRDVSACEQCPRLVSWCWRVAEEKVKRHRDETYWGRPVPSLGKASARVLVIGLAPAAHGSNRTGRMFTGDRSGEWLFRAMHRTGFANQPTSTHADDGLELIDCYVTAAAHCAPPDNKPLPEELANCRPFLLRELDLLEDMRVIVALGKLAFDVIYDAYSARMGTRAARPKFGHGAEHRFDDGVLLVASFHPSQQNTFTGRLTEPMLDAVFERARTELAAAPGDQLPGVAASPARR